MSKTPPDDAPESPQVSPYGPASPTPDSSPVVPPIEPPAAPRVVPPIEAPPATAPSRIAPPAAGHVPPPAPYGAPQPPSPYRAVTSPPYPVGQVQPARTMSVLSLVMSLIGVLLICCAGVGLLFAIAGIVLGHLGQRKESAHGLALAGLIIGYFVAALSLIVIVLGLASSMSNAFLRY